MQLSLVCTLLLFFHLSGLCISQKKKEEEVCKIDRFIAPTIATYDVEEILYAVIQSSEEWIDIRNSFRLSYLHDHYEIGLCLEKGESTYQTAVSNGDLIVTILLQPEIYENEHMYILTDAAMTVRSTIDNMAASFSDRPVSVFVLGPPNMNHPPFDFYVELLGNKDSSFYYLLVCLICLIYVSIRNHTCI